MFKTTFYRAAKPVFCTGACPPFYFMSYNYLRINQRLEKCEIEFQNMKTFINKIYLEPNTGIYRTILMPSCLY